MLCLVVKESVRSYIKPMLVFVSGITSGGGLYCCWDNGGGGGFVALTFLGGGTATAVDAKDEAFFICSSAILQGLLRLVCLSRPLAVRNFCLHWSFGQWIIYSEHTLLCCMWLLIS